MKVPRLVLGLFLVTALVSLGAVAITGGFGGESATAKLGRRHFTGGCFHRRITHSGTSNPEVIAGTVGQDVMRGRDGGDTILGLSGRDRICGNKGDDHLIGGDGFDRLNGGPGFDQCEGEIVKKCEG